MLTGKRFTLTKSILALEATGTSRMAVPVPAGAIIEVISGPSREGDVGTVSVLWEGRSVAMFAIDVQLRAVALLPDKSAGA